jgi:hypothetical protein
MKQNEQLNLEQFNQTWEPIYNEVIKLAKQHEGNIEALLSLLRLLENIHKEIREGLFQEALPDNRQALYSLLKDIESTGGWPYIYRGRLKSLLARLAEDDARNLLDPMVLDSDNLPEEKK